MSQEIIILPDERSHPRLFSGRGRKKPKHKRGSSNRRRSRSRRRKGRHRRHERRRESESRPTHRPSRDVGRGEANAPVQQTNPRDRAETTSDDVDRRKSVVFRCAIQKLQQQYLEKTYPHLKFDFRSDQENSPHCVAAWCLRRARNHAVKFGRKHHLFARARDRARNDRALDVGITKSLIDDRSYHSLDNSNSVRVQALVRRLERTHHLSRTPNDDPVANGYRGWTWCTHEASECRCRAFTHAVFINSLYYNDPTQLGNILLNTRERAGWSVHMRFPERSGSLFGGEYSYARDGPDVTVTDAKNGRVWRHPALDYVRAGSINTGICSDGARHSIHCSIRRFGDYEFAAFELFDHVTEESEVEIKPSYLKAFNSQLALGRLVKGVCDGTDYILEYHKRKLRIPKAAFDGLVAQAAGRPLLAKQMKQLISSVRAKLSTRNFPSYGMSLTSNITVIACFISDIVVAEDLPFFRSWFSKERLKKYQRYSEYVTFTRWPKRTSLWLLLMVTFLVIALVVVWWFCMIPCISILSRLVFKRFRDPHPGWTQFVHKVNNENISEYFEGSVPPGAGFNYSNVTEDPENYPMAENATLEELDGFDRDDCGAVRQATVVVGVGFSGYLPIVYAPSSHNLYVGARTRCVAAMPVAKPGKWKEVVSYMENELPIHHDEHLPNGIGVRAPQNELFPTPTKPMPNVTLEYYKSRFPPSKIARLEQCEELEGRKGFSRKRLCYNAFVKREKMMIVSRKPFKPGRPRIIQALSQSAKLHAGPWFLQYSEAMKRAWPYHNWIYYSSGATAEDHDKWFAHSVAALGGVDEVSFLYTDFSKYDMTQGADAIQSEIEHYRKLGFLKHVEHGEAILAAMYRSTVYAGRETSIRFSVNGTRKSGDSNTSSGNTRMTGFVIGSFLKHEGLEKFARCIVLGDDNLMVIHRAAFERKYGRDWENIVKEKLRVWATDLGFKLKVGLTHNVLEAEFCSGRFYPTNNGFKFGKKPGRSLSKIAYFLHKPGRTPEEYKGMLKGTLVSYRGTGMHVPFLRVYIDEVLKRLDGVEEIRTDKEYGVYGDVEKICDETTWTAFYELYHLNSDDEETFRELLVAHLDLYGIPSMMDSMYVNTLFENDFLLS